MAVAVGVAVAVAVAEGLLVSVLLPAHVKRFSGQRFFVFFRSPKEKEKILHYLFLFVV